MSNVTFLVDHMTDWQIWFSAFIVKYLKSTPDVDWDKLGEAMNIEPDFAKNYFEKVRELIQLKENRQARLTAQGKVDTHQHFVPVANPLADTPECPAGCDCESHKPVFQVGEVNLGDDKIEARIAAEEKLAKAQAEGKGKGKAQAKGAGAGKRATKGKKAAAAAAAVAAASAPEAEAEAENKEEDGVVELAAVFGDQLKL